MTDTFNLTKIDSKKNKKRKKKEKTKPENQESHFLVHNSGDFQSTKKHFLHYMITEESQFADLQNIENELRNESLNYKKRIDENTLILSKKKEELSQLNNTIFTSCLNAKTQEVKTTQIDDELKMILNKISSMTYDIETYEEEKQRLSTENLKLSNKLKNEIKELAESERQYSNYLIVKEQMEKEKEDQERLKKKMENFQEKTEKKYKKQVKEATDKYILLEKELADLKRDTMKYEEDMKACEKQREKLKNKNKESKEILKKIKVDLKVTRSDYFKNFARLHLIYEELKMTEIEKILQKFQKDNRKYNTNLSLYNFNLKILTELTAELSSSVRINNEQEKEKRYWRIKENQRRKLKNIFENAVLAERVYEAYYKEMHALKEYCQIIQEKVIAQDILIRKVVEIIVSYGKKYDAFISDFHSQFTNSNNPPKKNQMKSLIESLLEKKTNLNMADYSIILHFCLLFFRKILFSVNTSTIKLFSKSMTARGDKPFTVIEVSGLINEEEYQKIEESKFSDYEKSNALKNAIVQGPQGKRQNLVNKQLNTQGRIQFNELLNRFLMKTGGVDKACIDILGNKFDMKMIKFTNTFVKSKAESKKTGKKDDSSHGPLTMEEKAGDQTDTDDDSIIVAQKYNGEFSEKKGNGKKSKYGHIRINTDVSRAKYLRMNDLYKLQHDYLRSNHEKRHFDEIKSDFNHKTKEYFYTKLFGKTKKEEEEEKKSAKLKKKLKECKRQCSFGSTKESMKAFHQKGGFEREEKVMTSEFIKSYRKSSTLMTSMPKIGNFGSLEKGGEDAQRNRPGRYSTMMLTEVSYPVIKERNQLKSLEEE